MTHLCEGLAVSKVIDNAKEACINDLICPLICFEWSDDFDSALSTKASHKSCWVKTITILPYDRFNTEKGCTFPVAVGNKENCHEAVEKLFAEELIKLHSGKTYFYSKAARANVGIYLELVASLQDQPERQGTNHLMLGSGRYSTRWGYSGNLSQISKVIP